MTRDSERKPEELDDQEETGAMENRTGRSAIPGVASADDTEASNLKEIQVALVDDVVETESRDDEVSTRVRPAGKVSQHGPVHVDTVAADAVEIVQVDDAVDQVMEPTRRVGQSSDQVTLPVAAGLQAEVMSSPVHTVRPQQKVDREDEQRIASLHELTATHIEHQVDQHMEPEQRQSRGRAQLEIDEGDPVFGWAGGSPYGSTQPKLVIHRSKEGLTTLPFLQVMLRDTYTELEGGEPGADTVEFVANEPRVPQVQKNIVTLDLTESGWQATMRSGDPVIERNNVDIVPTLQEVASTLFTGELGYFVVNVPDGWEGDVVRRKFFDNLVAHISSGAVSEKEGNDAFAVVQSSPVVMATPHIESETALFTMVMQYFSLYEDDVDRFESVDQVAAAQERALRRNDWKRIAVTERQQRDDESDEHYLWKALVAEGLVWEMKQWFDREPTDGLDIGTFLQKQVLSEDRLLTEHTVDDGDEHGSVVADLYLSYEQTSWLENAIEEFFGRANEDRWDIAVEVETGRSEGAFNFRKVRESLEKYCEAGVQRNHIWVVLPSRLFYRGERRARMILDLVESWDELQEDQPVSAEVFVPVVTNGSCQEMRAGAALVDELYGGEDA